MFQSPGSACPTARVLSKQQVASRKKLLVRRGQCDHFMNWKSFMNSAFHQEWEEFVKWGGGEVQKNQMVIMAWNELDINLYH